MNINELDYSLSELNVAIKDHYDLTGKLLHLSLLGGEVDHEIIDRQSHRHCRFNHWLSLRLNGGALDRDMVTTMDEKHTAIHDINREMMQSIIDGVVTKSLLDKYLKALQDFIHSLEQYKDYLFSHRNFHDVLTGLPLRHLLYREFPLVREQCLRTRRHLYLLIMDIDRFKSINDTWGHNAGDDVLRNVALMLKDATRKTERIYRFGGEEFIILLDAQNDDEAQSAAARIRLHLQRHSFIVAGENIGVTVTCGLTRVTATDSLHEAIGRADKAMYHGKKTGRNRCIMSTATEEMSTFS